MNVVVTGGAGFIGANLCRALADSPEIDRVVALDNLSTGRRSNLDGIAVDVVEGDILDATVLDEAFTGASAVVHLAAVPSVPRSVADPMGSHVANATGTMQVLEAVRRADRPYLVVASSSSVYGANPVLPKSEGLTPAPLSPYAASKLAAEAYALAYRHTYSLEVLALRFFNVFGPLQPADHDYAAVIPKFIASALAGTALPIHGDGLQTRDFTFVGSVVEVLRQAVLRRVSSPTPVNLAFGTRTTLLEAVTLLEDILRVPLDREHLPTRPGDVRDSQADGAQLMQLFPDVEPVSLVEGLRRTVEWFVTMSSDARMG